MKIFSSSTPLHPAIFYSFVLGFLAMLVISCSAPKNITYFRDIPDSVRQKSVAQSDYVTPKIKTDDILQVTIQTFDPTVNAMLNQQNVADIPVAGSSSVNGMASPNMNNSNNNSNVTGYLVDKDGNVILPLLGKVHVAGSTTEEVRDEITKKAAEYYKEPVVNVRVANFKITVLGEVTHPSTYIMPSEKVSLLDALGMAGDLTIYGKRENVLLIREKDNQKEMIRFNLNDSKLFTSPYFYLQQGDVVYVEPNKSKIASTDMAQIKRISIVASVLSVLIIIASRVNF